MYRGNDKKREALIAKFKAKKFAYIPDDLPSSNEENAIMDMLLKGADPSDAEKAQINDRLLLTFVRGFVKNRWKKIPTEEAVKKTIPIFKTCLQFRVKYDCANLLKKPERKDLVVFQRQWVHGVTGIDRSGRLVLVYHPFSTTFMERFPVDGNRDPFHLNLIRTLEVINKVKDEEEVKGDILKYKHTILLDLGATGLGMSKVNYMKEILSWVSILDKKEKYNTMSDFYPETLLSLWVVNTPFVFRAVWKIAKNFVDPITVKKFKLVAGVPLEDMAKAGIPLESIPKYLGGKGDDPKGYHYKHNVSAASMSSLKPYVVKKGQKLTWDIGTTADYLYVTIRTNSNHVILRRTKMLKRKYIMGFWKASKDCKVIVEFDNSEFSWYSSDAFYEIRIYDENENNNKKVDEDEKVDEA
jgi:hypothetical protein